jgi:tetratricopeptide (TPR) repeat protein
MRPSALIAPLLGFAIVAAACTGDPVLRKQRHFERANAYFDKGQYAEAIIEYRNAVSLDAKFGPARKRLAEAHARTGNAPASLAEYVRAADLLPADVDVQLNAGSLLLMARRPEEALARANAALKVDPDNVSALVLRGSALAGLTSFDEALKSFEGAIALDPSRGRTFSSLGLIELARGKQVQAESAFRRAVELSPRDVEVHLALGNFYWAVGRMPDAEQAFQSALKLDPSNVAANRFMASLTIVSGRQAEAEPYLQRVADSSTDPAGILVLTDYYLMTGRPKDAIGRLEGLKEADKIPGAQVRLARAYAAANDLPKARALVDAILKADASDADGQLLKAQLLLEDGKRDEAFEAVRTATSVNPSSADAQFVLGRMYVERGDNAAAQRAFQEVLKINPRAAAAQVQLARLQTQAGQTGVSVQNAEEAARNNPTNAGARLEVVRSLIASKEFGRAESEITRLRTDFPSVASVHVQEANLALLRKDYRRAQAALEQAEKLDPKSLETLASWLALDLEQKNTTGARTRLEARLQKESSPDLQLLAGRTYLAMKDSAAAEKALRAVIEADPSRLAPYEMLGQLYLSEDKLDLAMKEFEALSRRQDNPVSSITMTGMILEQRGRVDEAMKRYEEVLARDPQAGTAANNLAWILADRGENLDRALQLAQVAVAAAPETPQVIDTLGWVYYKRNLPESAIPYFQRCISKDPMVAEYHYHLGLAFLKAGKSAAGRAALQHALNLNPNPTVTAEIRRALDEAK